MAYESESDLKYIDSLSDIPVTGEGIDKSWSQEDKLDAAEDGEAKLEADANEGKGFNNSGHIHAEAAATWATYRLVLGMKTPDSTTRGDMLDEGSNRMDFANALKDDYYDYVQSIVQAVESESEGGPGTIDFRVADW